MKRDRVRRERPPASSRRRRTARSPSSPVEAPVAPVVAARPERHARAGVPAAQLGRAVGVVGEEEVLDRVRAPSARRARCAGGRRRRRAPRGRAPAHRQLRLPADRLAPPRGSQGVRGRVGSLVPCASRGTRPVRTRPTASSTETPTGTDGRRRDPVPATRSTSRSCSPATRDPAGGRAAARAGHPAQQGDRDRHATTPTTPREMGDEVPAEPLMFLKPNTAVVGPGDPVVLPAPDHRGRTTRASSPSSSAGSAKDVRAEDARRRASSATPSPTTSPRATCSAATASGPGPRASTRSARSGRGSRPSSTPRDLRSSPALDGEVRPGRHARPTWSTTSPTLVAHASQAFTLLPGDVILTGTPAGVGPVAGRPAGRGRDRGHRHAVQPVRPPRLTDFSAA